MKSDLVHFVRCPECAHTPLDFTIDSAACRQCSRTYPICDGVLDLHSTPTEGALNEIAGHQRLHETWLDEAVPRELHDRVTGEAGTKLYRNLPRVDDPEVAAAVPALARLNEIAGDYFELLEWLDIQPGQTVLEIGAHNGWSAQHFARRGAHVIATDISPGLAAADMYFDGDVCFDRVYSDMLVLPFNDACFDLVFTVATIHHTDDLSRLFAGFHRVLKAGGRAVCFSEPVAGRWDRSIKETFGQEEKEWGAQEHIYTISEYLRPARAAGFRAEVIPQTSLLREAERRWPAARRAALRLHRSGTLYNSSLTQHLYPFLLQFYPRIPFPRFALVMTK